MNIYWLIDQVLSGTASVSEKLELEEWIAKKPSHKNQFEDIKLLWKYTDSQKADQQLYDRLSTIKKRIFLKRSVAEKRSNRRRFVLGLSLFLFSVMALTGCCVYYSMMNRAPAMKFTGVPLMEVLTILKEDYNIEADVTESEIFNCRFTGSISANSTEENIMVVLSRGTGLHCQYLAPGRYTLSGAGCAGFIY